MIQQGLADVGALIRRTTAIRIDNTEPAVAAFFSRRPGVAEEDRMADIVFEILGHVIKVIDGDGAPCGFDARSSSDSEWGGCGQGRGGQVEEIR